MQKQVKFEQAMKTKYPEQVVIVIAKDKYGKANPVTLGWTMIASGDPPMMAIGVYKGHYTVKCIRHSKCWTLVYPSADMAKAALFFGSHSGRDTDKLAEFTCKTASAKKIDSVLLADAVANFECRLVKQIPTGDHITFVGQIVCSHINPKLVRRRRKRLYSLGSGHKLGAV
ncbi:MAG: flavin reductase family protein, partial [Sedimentisphaerales bacterium]|nr:flavin reductase family protein [Sedimentisphaerales bacterium]